jgi:hypothetical protein
MLLTKLLLLPLCLHVVLITVVGLRTVSARIKAVVSGEVKIATIATNSAAWPDRLKKLSGNFDNQFDTPMLWYSVCGLIVVLKFEDWLFAALSWLFLLSRIGHTFVHLGSNNVPLRMRFFLFGFSMLFMMWAWFTIRLMMLG